jgi:formamidopyrimidine-DNA glycosylase
VPELPDIVVYLEALDARVRGKVLERVRILNPFLLRSTTPPLTAVEGKAVTGLRRIGKRIVIDLDGEMFLVLHLMVAGRLRWLAPRDKVPGRITLALLEFSDGRLAVTEAGTKRRASLHLVQGETALAQFDMGGLEVLAADLTAFEHRLKAENHTLKRALTDPHIFSGIGNAYSDEILHRAKLSPVALTSHLAPQDVARLYLATLVTLEEWTQKLRADARGAFPEKVTAFREGMAVHGRFGLPCPVCGAPVQRIVYAENETNYCARCQTGGRVLADRALSRLLKSSWPRNIDELE